MSFRVIMSDLSQAEHVEVKNVDFNPAFISRMLPKLEWIVLIDAAEMVWRKS